MNPLKLAVGILSQSLGVSVSTEVPHDRPDRMVVVTLDGDRSDEFIMRPTIGLTCFGRSDLEAHDLSVASVAALRDAACTHPYLFAVDMAGRSGEHSGRTGEGMYSCLLELTINTDE